VTPARAALLLAERRLTEGVHQLYETEQGCSAEFVAVAQALALVVAQLRSDPGELLTTAQAAERLNVSPKTLRAKAKAGVISQPTRLAKRGASALRWRAQA
jgi:hypothetical protein